MITADDVLSIRPGTRLEFNYQVHIDDGPNPATWCPAVTVTEITHRGVTADCHPNGPGRPFVGIAWRSSPTSTTTTSVGTGDRHVRIAPGSDSLGSCRSAMDEKKRL